MGTVRAVTREIKDREKSRSRSRELGVGSSSKREEKRGSSAQEAGSRKQEESKGSKFQQRVLLPKLSAAASDACQWAVEIKRVV